MPFGYAGRILEVDLTTDNITTTTPDERILRQYIGGRGLAAKVLWDRLGKRWRSVEPLGPDNLLIVLTGPMTGYIPGSRICVSGKSPASNGIVGSTVAGEFPIELKCAGYDGIIVAGRAKEPVYILVTDEKAEIRDAKKLWGLDGKQTVKVINHEAGDLLGEREPKYGLWKEPAILYIGPAGETLNRTAAVIQKWSHAAGFGGYGALMGSKKLKAIVAKGTGPLPDVASPEEIQPFREKVYEMAFNNRVLRFFGTWDGYMSGAELSCEPVRNWQEEWHDEKSFGLVNFETGFQIKRYWSDYGCPMSCMKMTMVKAGLLKGAITDGPDYELQAYCGTNLGIFEPEGTIYIASLLDDLGFSGINGANVMGFAGELYQRGILTKEDFDGIEPRWGDAEAFGELAKLIAERRAIGNVLAEGTYRAAKKITQMKGVDVMPFAVQFKGMEPGAWGMRSGRRYICGYACSTQSGDHGSSVNPVVGESGHFLGDCLVFCTATLNWRPDPLYIWAFFKAVTGWDVTEEEWTNVIKRRIIQIQRAALLLGGPDIVWDPDKDDDNPQRWYEPLPTGPKAGMALSRAQFLEERKKFYVDMGWDERGIPTSAELKKLGLEDVDKVLAKLRD